MNERNPYAAPVASLDGNAPNADEARVLPQIAGNQRLLILALLLSIALTPLQGKLGIAGAVVLICSMVFMVVSVLRLASSLGSTMPKLLLYALAMFVPLLNWFVMVRLSGRATRLLRAAGYRVGLLGARAQ